MLHLHGLRLTLYDSDDTTVLTPAAGAPHSLEFKVASIAGVAGFQHYLVPGVTGRKGTFNRKTRKSKIGQIVLAMQDARTTAGGADADRFGTAFLGDAQGRARLIGKKGLVEETLDLGATAWQIYGTYRVEAVTTRGRRRIELVLRELAEELKAQVFVSAPHSSVTYAKPTKLWPVTDQNVAYGPWTSGGLRAPMQATLIQGGAGAIMELTGTLGGTGGKLATSNTVTKALADRLNINPAIGYLKPGGLDVMPRKKVRARVAWTSGALNGTTKDYWVASGAIADPVPGESRARLRNIIIVPVAAADPNYGALPATNDTGNAELLNWSEPSPECPLYLNDVSIGQLIQDLLDGKFYWLDDDGTTSRTWPYVASSISGLPADLPIARGQITGPASLDVFLEQQCCLVFGIGMRRDVQGRLEFFDSRLPATVAGLPVLTDADCHKDPPDWSHDRDDAISWLELKYYTDVPVPDVEVQRGTEGHPTYPPARIRAVQNRLIKASFGATDLGEKQFVVDAQLLRATPIDTDLVGGRQRVAWLDGVLEALALQFERPFGAGPMRTQRRCRRTTTVTGLKPGSFLVVQTTDTPDPATNRRGGNRLVQVEEVTPKHNDIILGLLDLGVTAGSSGPVLGTFAKDAGNPKHGLTLPVTLGAEGDPVIVQVAVTDTSVGSAPAADSGLWGTAAVVRASGTAVLLPFPSGKRCWGRARSQSDGVTQDPRVPSSWVATSPASVDLDAYAAPTGGSYSNATATTAELTWTNTETVPRIEVVDSSLVRLPGGLLRPRSRRFFATNLLVNQTQNLRVRYVDDLGGVGTDLIIAVTTNTTTPTAPTPRGLRVIPGTA